MFQTFLNLLGIKEQRILVHLPRKASIASLVKEMGVDKLKGADRAWAMKRVMHELKKRRG